MKIFNKTELKKLYRAANNSAGEENGQVTIIGGSNLFHGAPLFSLIVASRIVDMVFFTSPEPYLENVASKLKAKLSSFIWVPWVEVGEYIDKSDATLVGPGLKSFRSEKDKREAFETKEVTKALLLKYSDKKWVIDAGALQVMETDWIPKGAVLTPNSKELNKLFSIDKDIEKLKSVSEKYNCTIVSKGAVTFVATAGEMEEVQGGNAGLTKGGSGDVLVGLTVALLAKNDPHLAATSASYISKAAADELYKSVGTGYNSDDLASQIPKTFHKLVS